MDYKVLISDHSTFEAFQNGDQNAFRRIYEAFKRPVYITTKKIVKSAEDAEDITIQAFTLTWERRSGLQSMQHLQNVLFIIARNKSINYLRKGNASSSELTDDVLEQFDSSARSTAETDQIFADLVERLHLYIDQMPERRKKVCKMRYIEGKPADEVAIVLKVSIDAVYWHSKEGLKQLRAMLTKRDFNEAMALLISILLPISQYRIHIF